MTATELLGCFLCGVGVGFAGRALGLRLWVSQLLLFSTWLLAMVTR